VLFEANMQMNGLRNVQLVRAACADFDGHCLLDTQTKNDGHCRLDWESGEAVRCVRVDSVVEHLVECINVRWAKIDTEGCSWRVLLGMTNTLPKLDAVMAELNACRDPLLGCDMNRAAVRILFRAGFRFRRAGSKHGNFVFIRP